MTETPDVTVTMFVAGAPVGHPGFRCPGAAHARLAYRYIALTAAGCRTAGAA